MGSLSEPDAVLQPVQQVVPHAVGQGQAVAEPFVRSALPATAVVAAAVGARRATADAAEATAATGGVCCRCSCAHTGLHELIFSPKPKAVPKVFIFVSVGPFQLSLRACVCVCVRVACGQCGVFW